MKTLIKDRQVGFDSVADILRITEDGKRTLYALDRIDAEFGEGFALVKLDDAGDIVVRYDVNLDLLPDNEPGPHASCDCPTGIYRPAAPCKHWLALRTLRIAGRI